MSSTRVSKMALTMLTLSAVWLLPSIVQACPQCVQNNGGGNGFLWLMAVMILLPYPVVAVVARLIRETDNQDFSPTADSSSSET